MNRLTTRELHDLLHRQASLCVSLYLPVEKVGQDTRQGVIRLKKMLRSITQELRARGLKPQAIEELLQPAEVLVNNTLFWEHQDQGLALFLDENGLIQHALHQPCEESVTISDQFMLLPLIMDLAIDDSYYVLSLSLDDTRIYLAQRSSLTELDLPQPRSLKFVMNSYNLEKQLQHHSPSKGKGTIFHGSDSVKDQEKLRIEEFFRLLEAGLRSVMKEDRPMVVACVDYLFPIFKSACRNFDIIDSNISGSPENMKKEELMTQSWQLVEPILTMKQTEAIEQYHNRAGSNRVAQTIDHIMPAALQGRIETLLIQRNYYIWGDCAESTGKVLTQLDQPKRFGDPDLLSEAARLTLLQSGQVYVLDQADMPDETQCAAILRF